RRRVPHGLRPVPHQVVGCLDIHEEPSSSMKVIFWDVDGVLNNPGTWGAWSKLGWSAALEPHLVKKARDVVRATGAKCVLSSTWRIGAGLERTIECLKERGWPE